MDFTRIILLIFCTPSVYITATSKVFTVPGGKREHDPHYWHQLGLEDLQEALHKPRLKGIAKNIVLFIGDGMGVTANTVGRIYKGQTEGHSGEEGYLLWERFPNIALLKTYNIDRQVPDSAATATAYLTGVKGNYETVGVTGSVPIKDCQASLNKEYWLPSILKWAQDANKETGFVTTTRVTHATPAGLYAHSAHREWECDSKIKQPLSGSLGRCKDIARQLVEDEPGKNIKVILGGGRNQLGSPVSEVSSGCKREDGRNLATQWIKEKELKRFSHVYVTNKQQLQQVDTDNTEYIMGLFAEGHMSYELNRDKGLTGEPSLKEMTEVAIKRLNRSDNGFFLLVEAGRIDHGLHDGKSRLFVEDFVAMHKAVEAAIKMIDPSNTLFIVTADHSHVLTMNGYPVRGNDILGKTTYEYVPDKRPYTVLMYTTGPGYNYSWNGQEVVRGDLTEVDTTDPHFIGQSAVPTEMGYETHGGEDVAVFAMGPMAHLFHRVHEQTYVAHVMAYAACIGPYRKCNRPIQDDKIVYCVSLCARTRPGVLILMLLLAVSFKV